MTYVLSFDLERQRKAKNYYYSGLSSSLAKGFTILALTITAITLRLNVYFYAYVNLHFPEEAVGLFVFVLIGFTLYWLVSIPYDYYREYALERKYGFFSKKLRKWIESQLKKYTISLTLVLTLFEVAYNFTRFSLTWIFVGLTFSVAFIVYLSMSPSALVDSRLYESQKLKNKDLLIRFGALAEKAGLKDIQIYEMHTQKKTTKALADSNGAAKARKISLSDTLLANYSTDEIESIIGHELGHHKQNHQLKFAILFTAVLTISFGSSYEITQIISSFLKIGSASSITCLPLLVLVFGLIYAGFKPVTNTLSRWAEGICDQYELDLVKKPAAYISSIIKLTDQNLGYAFPNRIIEFIFYDHPSGGKRAKRALEKLPTI